MVSPKERLIGRLAEAILIVDASGAIYEAEPQISGKRKFIENYEF